MTEKEILKLTDEEIQFVKDEVTKRKVLSKYAEKLRYTAVWIMAIMGTALFLWEHIIELIKGAVTKS